MAKKNTPQPKDAKGRFMKKQQEAAEQKPDVAEKVEAKLNLIDSVGSIIYKYLKKWILAIIGIGTAISLYLGFDVFNAVGLKNPNAAQPKVERMQKHLDLDESYFEDMHTKGYHTDSASEFYDENEDYYMEEDDYFYDQQMQSSDEPYTEEAMVADTVVVTSRYIIDYLFDVDMEGDTFYIDVYSDGTDSIYYPKFEY